MAKRYASALSNIDMDFIEILIVQEHDFVIIHFSSTTLKATKRSINEIPVGIFRYLKVTLKLKLQTSRSHVEVISSTL